MPTGPKSIDNLAEIKALPGVIVLLSDGNAKRGFAEFEHAGTRVYRRWGVMRDNITPVALECRCASADYNPRNWGAAVANIDDAVRDQEFRNTVANVKTVQDRAEKTIKSKRKRKAA